MRSGAFTFAPLDHALGERINIRGGGGKTTLARAIAARHELRHIELDALFWLPRWRERETDEFCAQVGAALEMAENRWVVDGNYDSRLGDLVLRECDTVVWLDLPWRVMFWRVFRRSLRRAIDKKRICGDNTETWGQFLSRRSLWWYYITHRARLVSRGERFLPRVPGGVPVIRIDSPAALERFYELQGLVARPT